MASSAVEITTGMVMMPNVSEPAMIEVPKPIKSTKCAQAKQAIDDGRDAGQVDDGQADHPREAVILGVLGQVDGGGDRQRHADDGRADGEHERADDGRHDAAFGHPIGGRLGQKGPR